MLRVRVVFSGITGSPWLATHYFGTAGASGTQTEANDAVAAVAVFWGAVDAIMSSSVTWQTEPDVDQVELSGALTGTFATTVTAGTGGSAGDVLPIASQAVIRWLTSTFVGGRQLRGRTFVPALTESSTTAGRFTSSALSTLDTAASGLIASSTTNLLVWSRRNAVAASALTGSTWDQVGVLRSRRD